MPTEPKIKRLVAFVDGQALFHASREAFGYTYPNYDVTKIVQVVADLKGWQPVKTYFYTGVPDMVESAVWHGFWSAKLAVMGTRSITTFTRPLKYATQTFTLRDGSTQTVRMGREKGIDVRIALDVVRLAAQGDFDVGLIFSQDQDLSEAADEVKAISRKLNRWIQIASAYPIGPTYLNKRGINSTQWVQINKALYDTCIDPNDYRTRPISKSTAPPSP